MDRRTRAGREEPRWIRRLPVSRCTRSGVSRDDPCTGTAPMAQGAGVCTSTQALRLSEGAPCAVSSSGNDGIRGCFGQGCTRTGVPCEDPCTGAALSAQDAGECTPPPETPLESTETPLRNHLRGVVRASSSGPSQEWLRERRPCQQALHGSRCGERRLRAPARESWPGGGHACGPSTGVVAREPCLRALRGSRCGEGCTCGRYAGDAARELCGGDSCAAPPGHSMDVSHITQSATWWSLCVDLWTQNVTSLPGRS